MVKTTKKRVMSGWLCGACEMPYDWRTPNRLVTPQIGDIASDQIVLRAYSAPCGACDNIIFGLTLVTKLVKGKKFGVTVKGQTEGRREQLAEALATFISVDNARDLVTAGEVGQ